MSHVSSTQRIKTGEKLTPSRPDRTLWSRLKAVIGKRTYLPANPIPHYLQSSKVDVHLQHFQQLYYRHLSEVSSEDFLQNAVWITGSDGAIQPETSSNTVADYLDSLQQKLIDSVSFSSTVCGINAGMISIPMPWSLHFRSTKAMKPAITVEELLLEMIRTYWEDADAPIRRSLDEMRHPKPLQWQPRFPSQSLAVTRALDFECRWLHQAPPLGRVLGSHDLSTFIAEPFAVRPVLNSAQIVDVSPQGTSCRRLAIVASSDQVLTKVRSQYQTELFGGSPQEVLENQWYSLLCAVLRVSKNDCTTYIEETTRKLNEIDIIARRYPSTSQIQYLLHTQECHMSCAQACKKTAAKARSLFGDIELPASQYMYTVKDHLHALAVDIEYLADTLASDIAQIDRVKRLAIDQMELFDKRRNRVIGVLIAVYVPLAFATSFFSMSIEDNSTQSYWTNSTVQNEEWNGSVINGTSADQYPLLYGRLTDPALRFVYGESSTYSTLAWGSIDYLVNSNNNITANSGSVSLTTTNPPGVTLTWPMWMFWTVACTLVLGSIVLPIVGGRILRFVAWSSVTYRRSFRATASLVWMFIWLFVPLSDANIISGSNHYYDVEEISIIGWFLIGLSLPLAVWSVRVTFVMRNFWSCASRVIFAGILLGNALRPLFTPTWFDAGPNNGASKACFAIKIITAIAWMAALCRWVIAQPGESW
ncbi:unnamed protein product [Zymoseptoria tritici ST99CH_1E4]|uniref:Uncharacterized protein n=1 Tax=Zymoseptoria tritici ST99CH_1E4 TaxID=1276532 RepID=A0A2H1H0J4_ZYMTR|nr:unnamed protein product [Zymoseptoria tritici ST99CH_1E4]